jgi:site-specific recombinase XerD
LVIRAGLPRYGEPLNDLFPTEKGGLMPGRNLWQRMRDLVDELGFPAGLDLHSFRRSYATNLQTGPSRRIPGRRQLAAGDSLTKPKPRDRGRQA